MFLKQEKSEIDDFEEKQFGSKGKILRQISIYYVSIYFNIFFNVQVF